MRRKCGLEKGENMRKKGFRSISVIEIGFAERKKVIYMHSMQFQDR